MITKYERLVAVTPAKNEERFIRKCVDSVLNQTYPVTLHLIVDDHSEDETVKIVESIDNPKVKIREGLKMFIEWYKKKSRGYS